MPPAIVVATTQATAIAGVSNILAQILDHWQKAEPFTFSWSDFIRFLVLNIIVAPPNFHWQAWLEKTFPARKSAERYEISPESMELGESRQFLDKDDDRGKVIITETGREKNFNWVNTFKKWFLDCIFVGAIMNTLAFLIIMGMMKGKNLAELQTAVRKETIPIIIAGYKMWPIASIVSFTFIPVEKRIVFLSFIGMLWGIYMSLVAARQ